VTIGYMNPLSRSSALFRSGTRSVSDRSSCRANFRCSQSSPVQKVSWWLIDNASSFAKSIDPFHSRKRKKPKHKIKASFIILECFGQ
jgi:hypothetical protein